MSDKNQCFIAQINDRTLRVFSLDKAKEMFDEVVKMTGPLTPGCKEMAGKIIEGNLSFFAKERLKYVVMIGDSTNERIHIYLGEYEKSEI